MHAAMSQPKLPWRQRRGRLALLLALVGLAAALASTFNSMKPQTRPITLTAGPSLTTRERIARALVAALAENGLEARLVQTSGAEESLDEVDAGSIDFALVASSFPLERKARVREVAPLFVEALHLLVRPELAASVADSLAALRGRTIDLGPPDSATAGLARAVLRFAEVTDDQGRGVAASNLEIGALEAIAAKGERAALPDAMFQLATTPSLVSQVMIRDADYQLVALPFAEALRMESLLTDGDAAVAGGVERQYVLDALIPAFTYQIDPPVPPETLHTLGSQLLLVANDAVPSETVELVLEAVFSSRFARLTHPPLERASLALAPRLEHHPGTLAYLRRDKPFVTNDAVDALSNTLSIIGALAGSALFLWQWLRQRRQAAQDHLFGSYMLQVADIERRAVELELEATLELAPLAALQRELLQLNTQALERFAAGDLGGQSALADLLSPINSARDHIADLILHLRENLEESAEARGRSLQAVWDEAASKPEGES